MENQESYPINGSQINIIDVSEGDKKLKAIEEDLIDGGRVVLNATAHSMKFSGFQDMYFSNSFPPEYGVIPDRKLMNSPLLLLDPAEREGLDRDSYAQKVAEAMATKLQLQKK